MAKIEPLRIVNNFILRLENLRWIKRTPAFIRDYEKKYPYFSSLEKYHEVIQEECKALLSIKDEITDMDGLAGPRTKGGIHTIKWKSFMFKSGKFIEDNCALCPQTAQLLKGIPRIKQAFFSILDPHQHIRPHKGYYQGFLRYHLGVIIPRNNVDGDCWIRINDNLEDNLRNDKNTMDKSETYYWKNGHGIVFNDNYLHEAANETDEIRVVLFVDVLRRFPFWMDWLNRLIITIGYQTNQAKQVAKNAKIVTSAVS